MISVRVIKITNKILKLLRRAKADYNSRKFSNENFIDSQRVICQKSGKPMLQSLSTESIKG